MTSNTTFWFFITFFCILTQGFYSMLELAAVSFNRVRLQYYISKGIKRAIWLQHLLQRPSRLFGTIMLGVNVALQFGSQSSREFYASLGLDPDLAPITQVFLVVIIGELAPLFAARRYAEHVVMLGIPVIYATERILFPLIWLIGVLQKGFNRLIGIKSDTFDSFLTREELQKVIESQEEGEKEDFNVVVSNIFSLRNKVAKEVMIPLEKVEMFPSNATVQQFRAKILTSEKAYLPIYHKNSSNIVAIAFARDLIRSASNRSIRDFSRPPWFITQETKLVQILTQFKRNNQNMAVILNPQGFAIGIITLDRILEEIFGLEFIEPSTQFQNTIIERTFAGNMRIEEFNKQFGTKINNQEADTFAQLMFIHLGHHPEAGESIFVDQFEITAVETSLLGTKIISIHSVE